jgi:5-formyltetrahydrofolate cyclo-ligase
VRYGGPGAEKQRIRLETKQISMSLDPAYRIEASRSIIRQVLELPAWQKAKTVMAYVSMPMEPDTRELIEQALAEGKTLLLPYCVDREHMVGVPVTDLSGMKIGRLGIPEPEPLPEGTEVPEPEVILVPCVAATLNGIRLGHGAGYFDRFLTEHRGMTICLCFRRLLRADLPAEDTDVPVDLVITD